VDRHLKSFCSQEVERKVHKRAITPWGAESADPLAKGWVLYLQKIATPGVSMKFTTLGIGAADLDGLDTMENLMVEAPSSIRALWQKIVAEEVGVG
jgi:hypothetical protein